MFSVVRMGRNKRYANAILQRLHPHDFDTVSADLHSVELKRGTLLFERGQWGSHTYFPITSVISFIGDTGEGSSVEVWAVGREGVAGISGILGAEKPFRGIVQVSGSALMCKTSVLRKHFRKCTSLHEVLLTYFDFLLLEISYLGICNNSHSIEHRFSRWLLMMQDRAQSSELRFTQDAIAGVLDTRRATISVAAAALQNAGLIRYTPGAIRIRSRRALERAACNCYRIIKSGSR
jgi:CRP-like cAMP-binding protein